MSKKEDKQTSYSVSAETLAETKRCNKDFSCQKGPREDLCPIDYCVAGKVHFIKCQNKEICPYQSTFGDGVICNCPTRKELYNKYGK